MLYNKNIIMAIDSRGIILALNFQSKPILNELVLPLSPLITNFAKPFQFCFWFSASLPQD